MKKRRYLRPSIEWTLTALEVMLVLFVGCVNDIADYKGLLVYVGLVIILILNAYVLKTWGRGLVFGDEQDEEI